MMGDIIKEVSKSYLYTHAAKDIAKFMRRNFNDVEFDRDYWLHKAGLAKHTPVKSTFASLSMLAIGVVAGGILGLALAPKKGAELRTDVKDKALNFLNRPDVGGQTSAHA